MKLTNVAYIQEYIPHQRDLRVILINYRPVLAYWRERPAERFKTNVFQGGVINFQKVPDDALYMARQYSKKCRFNDVGLDMMRVNRKWYLIEANMKYGRKGLNLKGMNLKEILREKILSGDLTDSDGL